MVQELINDLFGEYTPVENTYTETVTDGFVVSDELGAQTVQTIQYDIVHTSYDFNWSWGAGVLLFALVLYSFLRMIGGILKCK